MFPELEAALALVLIKAPLEFPEPERFKLFCVANPFKSSIAPELTVTVLVPRPCALPNLRVPVDTVVLPE